MHKRNNTIRYYKLFSNKSLSKRFSFKRLFDLFHRSIWVFCNDPKFFLVFSAFRWPDSDYHILSRIGADFTDWDRTSVKPVWLNHANTFSNTNIWTLNSRNLIAMLRSNLNMKPLVVIINRHFFFFFTKACKNSSPSTGKVYNTKLLLLSYVAYWQIVNKKNRRSQC